MSIYYGDTKIAGSSRQNVKVSADYNDGIKLATISVNLEKTDVYMPVNSNKGYIDAQDYNTLLSAINEVNKLKVELEDKINKIKDKDMNLDNIVFPVDQVSCIGNLNRYGEVDISFLSGEYLVWICNNYGVIDYYSTTYDIGRPYIGFKFSDNRTMIIYLREESNSICPYDQSTQTEVYAILQKFPKKIINFNGGEAWLHGIDEDIFYYVPLSACYIPNLNR